MIEILELIKIGGVFLFFWGFARLVHLFFCVIRFRKHSLAADRAIKAMEHSKTAEEFDFHMDQCEAALDAMRKERDRAK